MNLVKKENLSSKIITEIKNALLKGEMKVGDFLPPESQMAEKFGVCRASVREGLKILEYLGVVDIKQGSRTKIIDQMHFDSDQKVLPTISQQNIEEYFEVRLMIEPEVAKLAALKATEEDLQRIENTFCEINPEITESSTENSLKFHFSIIDSVHNELLKKIITHIVELQIEFCKMTHDTITRREDTLKEHRLIYDAIKSRNAEYAYHMMKVHLLNSYKDYHSYR